MMVITDAAPGLIPHSAVVPGSKCRRVISQPIRLQATTTDTMPALKSNQWLRMSPRIDSGTMRAIMQPMMPCAPTEAGQGNAARAPAGGDDESRDQGTEHQRGRRMQPQQNGADADRQDNERRPL